MTSSDIPAFGVKKSDFMKNSSFNFLENEKYYNSGSQGAHQTCNQTETDVQTQDVQKSSSENEEIFSSQKVLTDEKIEPSGLYYQKTFTSKCYFKPKQNPISYSETMIVSLGSNKKQYFDTVIYETKLIPYRWVETVRTVVPCLNENVFQTQHEVFINDADYHYMSLEPQQIAAVTQQVVDQIEVH